MDNIQEEFQIHALQTSSTDTIVQGAVLLDFGEDGQWFPNLICYAISTSATVDLYLK